MDVFIDEYPTLFVSIQPNKIRTSFIHSNFMLIFRDCVLDFDSQPLKDGSCTAQLFDQMVGVIIKWTGEYAVTRHCGSNTFFMRSLKGVFFLLYNDL